MTDDLMVGKSKCDTPLRRWVEAKPLPLFKLGEEDTRLAARRLTNILCAERHVLIPLIICSNETIYAADGTPGPR